MLQTQLSCKKKNPFQLNLNIRILFDHFVGNWIFLKSKEREGNAVIKEKLWDRFKSCVMLENNISNFKFPH